MANIKISIEDLGQDFTALYINEKGIVIDAKPFQAALWRGAIIPIHDTTLCKVGEHLPIHCPPHIEYGFLRYKITKIEQVAK